MSVLLKDISQHFIKVVKISRVVVISLKAQRRIKRASESPIV